MGDPQNCARPTPRALDMPPDRLNNRVKPNRHTSAPLAGKQTFAADAMGDGNTQASPEAIESPKTAVAVLFA
jgi:hypothetical protein